MTISSDTIIQVTRNQRNLALDEWAKALGEIAELREQLAALASQITPKKDKDDPDINTT